MLLDRFQERKMELHQAIVSVERGGSADGILQVIFYRCLMVQEIFCICLSDTDSWLV